MTRRHGRSTSAAPCISASSGPTGRPIPKAGTATSATSGWLRKSARCLGPSGTGKRASPIGTARHRSPCSGRRCSDLPRKSFGDRHRPHRCRWRGFAPGRLCGSRGHGQDVGEFAGSGIFGRPELLEGRHEGLGLRNPSGRRSRTEGSFCQLVDSFLCGHREVRVAFLYT